MQNVITETRERIRPTCHSAQIDSEPTLTSSGRSSCPPLHQSNLSPFANMYAVASKSALVAKPVAVRRQARAQVRPVETDELFSSRTAIGRWPRACNSSGLERHPAGVPFLSGAAATHPQCFVQSFSRDSVPGGEVVTQDPVLRQPHQPLSVSLLDVRF